ncbi:MAG: FAD-dependent monooxygenase [Chloroflexi bacterium]|nr:FAD-dependent monooxygenase [Chloroflexota bacterium]
MYDAVVVGARCAGASVAMLLARRGQRVALVDRAAFPSDTLSTHFLWQRGAARLQAWGLLDRLRGRGCQPIDELAVDFGPVVLSGRGDAVDGVVETYCPRRTVLDQLLVDAALEAGAEFFEGCVVDELAWSDGRVVGIRGRSRSGSRLALGGRLVVGADGLHSTVVRQTAAEAYAWHPPLTCVYYAYWSGIEPRRASFHPRPGRLILVWPTNDELTCVCVAWRHADFARFQADVEGNFLATLELVDGLRERVTAGRRETSFYGTADLPNQYRASHGPGWALVGDAGHHKDPATGMGMSDAFLSAELLAAALDDAQAGRRSPDEALAAYSRVRDAATDNSFRLTLRTAALEPVAEHLLAYYARAATDPEQIRLVLGALGGSLPFREVYSRERIEATLN